MLVLLPPSEGKTPPDPLAPAAPVDLGTLVYPELNERRARLMALLGRVATGPPKKALAALGLSPGQAAELERDRDLASAPAAPAAEVYTGVLYQHLALSSLAPGARAKAAERLLIASALWGVVRLEDRIPAYRLNMNARLPRIRGLAAWWRPALTAVLPADGLLVDLRSQTYAAAWRPTAGTVVEVRAFVETNPARPTRTVITHMAKATRGDVARLLARARTAPRDPAGVAAVVERGGHRVELTPPAPGAGAWRLDVVLRG